MKKCRSCCYPDTQHIAGLREKPLGIHYEMGGKIAGMPGSETRNPDEEAGLPMSTASPCLTAERICDFAGAKGDMPDEISPDISITARSGGDRTILRSLQLNQSIPR
jgi:hypothetical protein